MTYQSPLTRDVARNACRSWLFVPADNDRALAKARLRGADVLILDLEDAVAPPDKAATRAGLAERIAMLRAAGPGPIVVRVNYDDELLSDDVAAATDAGCDAIMLPKAEAPGPCAAVARMASLRRGAAVGVVALVESPRAVLGAMAIADAPGLIGIAFGSEDFAANMACAPTSELLTQPCRTLALVAAAAGIAGLGLPVSLADYADVERYATAVRMTRAMGMTGAMCIHPMQIGALNAAFIPTEEERNWAEKVMAAARESGSAVVSLNGAMLDRPVIEWARLLLARAGGWPMGETHNHQARVQRG